MSPRVPRGVAAPPSAERERFGKYEILRRIAVGGMAEIYLARALGLEGFEKLVVLKRILPQYANNDEFVQMFLDEARVAATLHHSNVVQVYDIGSVDGQYFLSMEFLHGQDGRQLMKACATRHAPLRQENALAIAIGMLAGLHYAHERIVDGRPLDLVHRDVSPQNVFVTYDGGVKLLDFGIARASSRLTETRGGTLKGKIAYMSPEQCGGYPLDRRSDIFAASIILWEMTVGRRLFTGSSDFEILRKVKEEDAPRPSTVLDYPYALEQIVMKGLARDRERRYATAEEMQIDLEAFARDRKLAVSAVSLGRFVRELFRPELEAWHAAERAGQTGEPVVQTTPSGNLIRTETSLSGLVPPPLDAPPIDPALSLSPPSDPAFSLSPPTKHRRGLIAVALGVLGGSLVTWLLVRQPAPPVPVAAPTTAVSVPTHAVRAPAAPPPERELPAPSVAPLVTASPPMPTAPPPTPTALPQKPTAPPPKPTAAAHAVVAHPAPAHVATVHTAPPPPHKAAKKPLAKKLPAGWDPESLLPP